MDNFDEAKRAQEMLELRGLINEQDQSRLMGVFSELIQNAPLVSPVDRSKAPFRDYSENTQDRWKLVDPKEVETYLINKFFFDTGKISSKDLERIFSIYVPPEGQMIRVPLDLVVNAKGFEDWRGRDPKLYTKTWGLRGYGYGESKSLDVIKLYSGSPTQLPHVGRMLMFIQPDGKIFFDNCSGDSHRMTAAILRGYEFVETEEVHAYLLRRNYI